MWDCRETIPSRRYFAWRFQASSRLWWNRKLCLNVWVSSNVEFSPRHLHFEAIELQLRIARDCDSSGRSTYTQQPGSIRLDDIFYTSIYMFLYVILRLNLSARFYRRTDFSRHELGSAQILLSFELS